MTEAKWEESVILVDADFLDNVAFDLIVNFERMINRRIPAADLCHWLDCIALDGGLRPGGNALQAVFLHGRNRKAFKNFAPADFADELNGKAFKDNIGEFALLSFPVEEVVSLADFFEQSLENILASAEVKRVMVVADLDKYGDRVKRLAAQAEGKDITLFAMQPITGRGFSQEILGYSLMSALGIRGDEIQ
ncbi:MAG: hypothetical protein Q4E59_05750 [Bacteroidales bacterium]|nr:hypothetical protein [Bacteroidales bacterium]